MKESERRDETMRDAGQEDADGDACSPKMRTGTSALHQVKRELALFFTALMFYTRVPCPRWVGYSEENLTASVRYLPAVGWLVGGVTAGALLLCMCVLPPALSVALAMVASIFLTGAFHEDGLADVCDGFGGGWSKMKILDIMKDSRLGTYGASALLLILLVKFLAVSALLELPASGDLPMGVFMLLLMVSAHGLSRLMAILTIVMMPYVREDELSKAKPVVKSGLNWGSGSLWCAVAIGVGPLFLLQSSWVFLVILPMLLVKLLMDRFFKKWIGGYTGDCLGAIQQITEVVFYISIITLWSFI